LKIETMKILMVCLGNICRSPLAEGIMQHLLDEQQLGWSVDSAGTGGWHVGEAPDRRSVQVAREHGIDINKQMCRKFSASDFADFDHIFVMDNNNLQDVLDMAPDGLSAEKVKLLLGDKEVPDPYYDNNQFEPVFELIESGCKNIVEKLTGLPKN
jgi:protein-tyrosine phosphatase